MEIEFDSTKDKANVDKHGISLALGELMDLLKATIIPDDRQYYGEQRYLAYGDIKGRLHAMVFTYRNGRVRVISLRKANKRERKVYE